MSWRGYETTKEAGKRWGVSSMWVSQLCKQGRVPGAGKIGGIWLIPDDAPKPEDGRTWNGKYIGARQRRRRSRRK